MNDEILIKGADGKWYVLKDGEMVVLEEETRNKKQETRVRELPKGVGGEVHERLEQKTEDRRQKTGIVGTVRPPSSVLRPPVSHDEHPLRVELEEIIQNVELRMQNEEWMKDSVLKKRFRNIVSMRLRDVRDAQETREVLVRPVKIGGMGLVISGGPASGGPEAGPRPIDWITEIIEKAFQEFQEKWRAVEEKRKQEWIRLKRDKRDKQDKQEQVREGQELEERYRRLTGGIPKSQTSITKEIPKPKVQIPKTQEPPKVKLALPPPPPAVISRTSRGPSSRPTPPHPFLSPRERGLSEGSRQPSAVSRPTNKITDIRPAPKLIGPIEELQSITLADFRRLGASPQDAILKIEAKIQRLRAESLLRGTQGVSAWRLSPLQRLYSQIMSEALIKRVSPEEIISQKGNMTADEFNAIMELNQKLRF